MAVAVATQPMLFDSSSLDWHVSIDAAFVVTETICPAVAVAPEDKRATDFLLGSRLVGGCTEIVLDLGRAADVLGTRESAARVADDVVVASPDVWLWRPRPARSGKLRVSMPAGWSAVLPFPESVSGGHDVDASTWAFLSAAVFGKAPAREVAVAGSVLKVVMLPGDHQMVRSDVDRWLTAAAESVASSNRGRFPFPSVVVVVDPVWGKGVPFGMISRGGGPQALLLLGERADVRDVVDDWVAVHELSHLLMPPVGVDEAWLGEGLASYHQNILRARTGLMSEAQAWEALRDGFERGASASQRGPFTLSLGAASARMRADGRYLQVYWGGAAVALTLDVGLRRCADVSIDELAASFRVEQPLVDVRRIQARDFVLRAAGMAPGCAHLVADVDEALALPFPETHTLLRDLGVSPGRLSNQAPLASLRQRIARAR